MAKESGTEPVPCNKCPHESRHHDRSGCAHIEPNGVRCRCTRTYADVREVHRRKHA